MIKKYEIINDGDVKRIKALRSFHVQGRYVNIGDVGGIVYDENTLSQEGNCWIFRGNFGFPGARIGGDSIVDVGEATLSATGAPNVDILGSSVVAGGKLLFEVERTAADIIVLKGADFEQGSFTYARGANWETWKAQSVQSVRLKTPIFAGGTATTLKISVPGYKVQAFVLDRDGLGIAVTDAIGTGADVTLEVPAGQYFTLTLAKNPAAAIVPADATTAAITFTGTYETRLSIVDSRVDINQVTSTRVSSIKPGGRIVGVPYPEAIIRNSKVSVNASSAANATARIMGQIIESNVTLDATSGEAQLSGIYSNVKNLMASGMLSTGLGTSVYNAIQVTDCNDFAVSPTVFPGYAAGISANMLFTFRGCNVPNGLFYHNAKVKNTYTDIDFAKAQADLGKTTVNGYTLCSAEVEGMYRLYSTVGSFFGALVETHDSVKSLNMGGSANTYGTTIYKDAYFRGKFDFAGTNVFGNKVPGHPRAAELKAKPRVVQGTLNTVVVGKTVTGVVTSATRVVTPIRYRINSAKGISVKNLPTGIRANIVVVNEHNVIEGASSVVSTNTDFTTLAMHAYAFVIFSKTGDAAITPDDLGDTTITVYNGCKIMNTGETAIKMRGNIRVEDNATLVNASVVGSGYFGGNSVVYYNPAVWAALECNGSAFMKGNAVFAPKALTGACALVHMEDNAKFIGSVTVPSTNLSFIMGNNAVIEGTANTHSGVVMSGNAKVTPTGIISSNSRGALVMKDNASIAANTIVIGAITLAGNYKGDVEKTWIGKRTITDVNAPEYDDNVRTEYEHKHDF
jgi:hypothetical protein